MPIEELKTRVTENIQYLIRCTDFASKEARNAAEDTTSVLLGILDQPDVQRALAKRLATLDLGKLFNDIWKSLSGFIAHQEGTQGRSICSLMWMYCKITDISDDVSMELGEAGCLGLMIEALGRYRDEYTASGAQALKPTIITILNAIQQCTNNVSIYRKANAIAIFKRYLDCDDMATKFHSLSTLAYIVNEEESALLHTTNNVVGFLLSLVKDAISNENHRVCGTLYTNSSALELLGDLNKLPVNDTNKRAIARLGGINVFTKMLTNEFSEDEQRGAVQALLNMSFIEELRSSKELQKSVKGLEKLVKSNNDHLQQMATYALWQITGQQLNKPDAREDPPSYADAMTRPTRSTKPNAQVMISYQWDNQKTTRKLRDLLVQAGYQVWMDITHMRGSMLDAMAKAVETSSLVLVCMSERYKNSENCRAGIGPIQASRQKVTAQEPSSSKKLVRQWSKYDVQEWLSDNDLSQLCDAFKGLKGGYLEEMYDDMKDNKDSFKQELQNEYKMDGKTRRVFIAALKEACEE